jgi:hypothetical protein
LRAKEGVDLGEPLGGDALVRQLREDDLVAPRRKSAAPRLLYVSYQRPSDSRTAAAKCVAATAVSPR